MSHLLTMNNQKQLIWRPESEREILRCAPPFDAEEEHKRDLEYESRVDYESWQHGVMEENDDAE